MADLELPVSDFITERGWQRQQWCVHCFKCPFVFLFDLERKTQKTKDVYIYDCYNFNWYILLNVKHIDRIPKWHTHSRTHKHEILGKFFVSCWPVCQSDEQMSPFTSNFYLRCYSNLGQGRGKIKERRGEGGRKHEHLRPLVLSVGWSTAAEGRLSNAKRQLSLREVAMTTTKTYKSWCDS